MVFTVDADKLDERKKIVKALKDIEAAVPFLSLEPRRIDSNGWPSKLVQLGFTFTGGSRRPIDLIHRWEFTIVIGRNREDFFICWSRSAEASADVIDQLVARSTEQNVFILIEDIVNVRLERAFVILEELLKQREEPIKIAALIARQFRIMLQVKELSKQGYSQQQMASQIGLHPFAVKVAEGQARKYDMEKLSRIMVAAGGSRFANENRENR